MAELDLAAVLLRLPEFLDFFKELTAV